MKLIMKTKALRLTLSPTHKKNFSMKFIILLLFIFLTDQSSSSYFVARECNDLDYVGESCNISMKPCDLLQSYPNMESCTDDPTLVGGYNLTCMPGFNGTDCEFDNRPCQFNTCLQKGASLFSLSLYIVRN